jgi:hypothetical protein
MLRKTQPQPPDQLPGRYLVMKYNRETEAFVIVLDDADHSSYNLGSAVGPITIRMENVWRLAPFFVTRIMGMARTFKAVQAVFADQRIIALIERSHRKINAFQHEVEDADDYAAIPL